MRVGSNHCVIPKSSMDGLAHLDKWGDLGGHGQGRSSVFLMGTDGTMVQWYNGTTAL